MRYGRRVVRGVLLEYGDRSPTATSSGRRAQPGTHWRPPETATGWRKRGHLGPRAQRRWRFQLQRGAETRMNTAHEWNCSMELEPESGQRYMLEQPLPYPRQSAIPEVIILQNLRVFRPLLLPHDFRWLYREVYKCWSKLLME
jgi:hypothetical protein